MLDKQCPHTFPMLKYVREILLLNINLHFSYTLSLRCVTCGGKKQMLTMCIKQNNFVVHPSILYISSVHFLHKTYQNLVV